MCFLALLWHQLPEYPLVLAANRDEQPRRAGTAPQPLATGIWGGAEPLHGGTWLGVNASGCVAAIANRRETQARDESIEPRSRGLLCLDLLHSSEPGGMAGALRTQVAGHNYRPFNLLFGNGAELWCSRWDGEQLSLWQLTPGIHVLGNNEIDDPTDAKVQRGRGLITPASTIGAAQRMLIGVCADHGTRSDKQDAICIHHGSSPTLCCSTLALHAAGMAGSHYLHGNSPPCNSALLDYSRLLSGASA